MTLFNRERLSISEYDDAMTYTISWKDDELTDIDVADCVGQLLTLLNLDESDHFRFGVILSELLINSIDHGLLGLSSSLKESADGFAEYYKLREEKLASLKKGQISMSAERYDSDNDKEEKLKLTLVDSGCGFDYSKLNNDFGIAAHSGRGIKLVRQYCDALTFSQGGRRVEVIYAINSG